MYSCEAIWVKVLVSKGWVQYKHYNGKKQTEETGGGGFSGVLKKYIASGFFRG